jgi:hypothetical protein
VPPGSSPATVASVVVEKSLKMSSGPDAVFIPLTFIPLIVILSMLVVELTVIERVMCVFVIVTLSIVISGDVNVAVPVPAWNLKSAGAANTISPLPEISAGSVSSIIISSRVENGVGKVQLDTVREGAVIFTPWAFASQKTKKANNNR